MWFKCYLVLFVFVICSFLHSLLLLVSFIMSICPSGSYLVFMSYFIYHVFHFPFLSLFTCFIFEVFICIYFAYLYAIILIVVFKCHVQFYANCCCISFYILLLFIIFHQSLFSVLYLTCCHFWFCISYCCCIIANYFLLIFTPYFASLCNLTFIF